MRLIALAILLCTVCISTAITSAARKHAERRCCQRCQCDAAEQCGPHCVCADKCDCQTAGQCIEDMQVSFGISARANHRLRAENADLQKKVDWLSDGAMRMSCDYGAALFELHVERNGRVPEWVQDARGSQPAIAQKPCDCICDYYKPGGCDCVNCDCPRRPVTP